MVPFFGSPDMISSFIFLRIGQTQLTQDWLSVKISKFIMQLEKWYESMSGMVWDDSCKKC